MTGSSINRGLAAMPPRERSVPVDGQSLRREKNSNQPPHREAMARNTSPKGSNPSADLPRSQWDDDGWDQDQDEAAGNRARRLLSRPNSGLHRLGDYFVAARGWLPHESLGETLPPAGGGVVLVFAG